MKSSGFSTYGVMSSANSDSLISFFPVWIPFLFLVLIAVARTPNAMLNKSGKSGHLVLFLILEEMLSDFHH